MCVCVCKKVWSKHQVNGKHQVRVKKMRERGGKRETGKSANTPSKTERHLSKSSESTMICSSEYGTNWIWNVFALDGFRKLISSSTGMVDDAYGRKIAQSCMRILTLPSHERQIVIQITWKNVLKEGEEEIYLQGLPNVQHFYLFWNKNHIRRTRFYAIKEHHWVQMWWIGITIT